MTYEEIIKGLTVLSLYAGLQEKHIQVLKASIDLIKCQKVVIESLKNYELVVNALRSLDDFINNLLKDKEEVLNSETQSDKS